MNKLRGYYRGFEGKEKRLYRENVQKTMNWSKRTFENRVKNSVVLTDAENIIAELEYQKLKP
jgi:hypothetical protein